jgi:hypothetical protein
LSLKEKCQQDLLTFWRALVPDFETTCHHETLAKILQEVLTDGQCQRLSINCPPRLGKSSGVVRALAWAAGNSEGGLNHFLATYGLDLSNKHKTLWNQTVKSEQFAAIFGKTKAESIIMPLFTSPKATGTGIAAGSELMNDTYRGVMLFDDMVKQISRAPLPTTVSDWYTSVAYARRQKRNCSINIGTRFGINDFTGMLRSIEGIYHAQDNPDGYKFVNLPALLGGDQSYWPGSEHMKTESLLKMRENPATSETFWTVFQGEPEHMLNSEDPISFAEYGGELHGHWCSIDTSKGMCDPTAIILFAHGEQNETVIVNFWELWGLQSVSTLKNALDKLDLPSSGVVEDVGFGSALDYTRVISNRSKHDRLISSYSQLQNMYKVPGLNTVKIEEQINQFGAAQYDDLMDCCTQSALFIHKIPQTVDLPATRRMTMFQCGGRVSEVDRWLQAHRIGYPPK